MSEPESFYLRVTMSEAAYASFRKSSLAIATDYDDWLPWLEAMAGSVRMTEADIRQIAEDVLLHPKLTVDDWIDSSGWGSKSNYDTATSTWTFLTAQFGENNYRDYIEDLAILRAVARFKDLPGDDFILIWPHFWGGLETVYVRIGQ